MTLGLISIRDTSKLTNVRFHFHFVPGSQQAYQYLQIAISMVIDLRLDHEAAELLEQRTEMGDTYAQEACCAYLGCYYMSSV